MSWIHLFMDILTSGSGKKLINYFVSGGGLRNYNHNRGFYFLLCFKHYWWKIDYQFTRNIFITKSLVQSCAQNEWYDYILKSLEFLQPPLHGYVEFRFSATNLLNYTVRLTLNCLKLTIGQLNFPTFKTISIETLYDNGHYYEDFSIMGFCIYLN